MIADHEDSPKQHDGGKRQGEPLSEMAYSRPGTFQRQIMGACANAGVTVIMVDPKGTSITCHQCGHSPGSPRRFLCTNDKCYNDINAT